MELNFKKNAVFVFVEDGKLYVETDSDESEQIPLTTLFAEYMGYYRHSYEGTFCTEHTQEVLSTVGLLRMIAREMEAEVEGSRV